MKSVMKKFLGGAISVALTMAMALGSFAGTGMEVRAADGLTFVSASTYYANNQAQTEQNIYELVKGNAWLSEEELLSYQEWIEKNCASAATSPKFYIIAGKNENSKYLFQIINLSPNGRGNYLANVDNLYNNTSNLIKNVYVLTGGSISTDSSDSIDLKFRKVDNPSSITSEADLANMIKGNAPTDVYQMMRQIVNSSDYDSKALFVYSYSGGMFEFLGRNWNNYHNYYDINHYSSDFADLNISWWLEDGYTLYVWDDSSSGSSGNSNGESSSSGDSYVPHVHSYSWVTVQDVSSEQDGIEEYRCSCGDVQERCVIPRYMAIVKGLFGEIKDAPQNGTATFDSGRLYTISDYVIKKLAERTDVTTVITFEYQNQAYKMTIPAGVDYTSLLTDEDYFYGYFYFAKAVGATIESL